MNTLRGFIRKEFSQVLRDARMRALLFIAPLIQLTLFSVAISNEVKNVELAVFAAPEDELANTLVEERWPQDGSFQQAILRTKIPGLGEVGTSRSRVCGSPRWADRSLSARVCKSATVSRFNQCFKRTTN